MKNRLKFLAFALLLIANNASMYAEEILTIPNIGDFKEVISKEEIASRVQELGRQIDEDYEDVTTPIIFLGVLNGCLPFHSDLVRSVKHSCKMETCRVSSYNGGVESSGEIILKYDSLAGKSLKGFHVIIVEDIVETGLTMEFLVNLIKSKNPESIKIASAIVKEGCLKHDIPAIDYVGFTRSPEFLIGYGLDFEEEYRNLPGIWARIEN